MAGWQTKTVTQVQLTREDVIRRLIKTLIAEGFSYPSNSLITEFRLFLEERDGGIEYFYLEHTETKYGSMEGEDE